MGILDDAIREHLELKRSHGATDSELRRLEDEAFGPPSRPGEPDFPESEEMPEQAGNGLAAETAVVDAPSTESTEVDEQPAAELPIVEEEGLDIEAHPEEEPPAGPPSDQAPAVEEPPAAPPSEVPIESLETVEHPFPDEVVEPEGAPGEETEPAHDEPGAEPPPATEEGPAPATEEEPRPEEEHKAEEGDDVLADTPDFLKDAPEDDELWFEQGEPKDFDF